MNDVHVGSRVDEGTETVLNDPESARYTHTLTISLAGVYTCTVANNLLQLPSHCKV